MARKTVFKSRFPQAKAGAHQAVTAAVKEALIVGQETAQGRLAANRSGYDLDPGVVWKKHFKSDTHPGELDGGMIFVHSDKWYYRFFETGTVYIPASPFIRPGNTRMRKTFVAMLGANFEGYISRRARL